MPEEIENDTATAEREAEQEQQESTTEELSANDKEALARLAKQRDESRKKAADLEKELEAIRKKQREADEAKAKEDGQYKELLEAREKELEQIKADLAARDLRDRKSAIARKHGIPDEFVDRLKGDSDEDIEEDAKRVAKLLKPKDTTEIDAGERSSRTARKDTKPKFNDPARWGLQRR